MRTQRMIQMKRNGMTYQEIGDFYGISRQRTHQILKPFDLPTSGEAKRVLARSLPNMTNKQLGKLFGCSKRTISKYRGDQRHEIEPGTSQWVGATAEEEVAAILESRGYNVELMPYRHPFDILIGRKIRADVKKGMLSDPPSSKIVSPFWSFQIRGKDKRKDCDVFLLYISEYDVIFIVPSKDTMSLSNRTTHIRFVYPEVRTADNYTKITDWRQYERRYDIIDNMLNLDFFKKT